MADSIERTHYYDAEATALSGSLTLPLVQEIKPQAHVSLSGKEPGYLSQRAECFRVESVISFRSAYTQVAGNRDRKPGHGWSTLATSVVEDLNVLDVLTADRIVSQIATDHPPEGYIPSVTFLGTRFENLRIAGHPVRLDLDPNFLGPKPARDAFYTDDSAFLERATAQHKKIRSLRDLPDETAQRYNQLLSTSQGERKLECSLVSQAEGGYPGRNFGHVIDVPNFGRIYLAVLCVQESDYKKDTDTPRTTTISLTMVDIQMGCFGAGNTAACISKTNGGTRP